MNIEDDGNCPSLAMKAIEKLMVSDMTVNSPHPGLEDFEAFENGTLPPFKSLWVEEHLICCSRCEMMYDDSLMTEDILLAGDTQSHIPADISDPPVFYTAIDGLHLMLEHWDGTWHACLTESGITSGGATWEEAVEKLLLSMQDYVLRLPDVTGDSTKSDENAFQRYIRENGGEVWLDSFIEKLNERLISMKKDISLLEEKSRKLSGFMGDSRCKDSAIPKDVQRKVFAALFSISALSICLTRRKGVVRNHRAAAPALETTLKLHQRKAVIRCRQTPQSESFIVECSVTRPSSLEGDNHFALTLINEAGIELNASADPEFAAAVITEVPPGFYHMRFNLEEESGSAMLWIVPPPESAAVSYVQLCSRFLCSSAEEHNFNERDIDELCREIEASFPELRVTKILCQREALEHGTPPGEDRMKIAEEALSDLAYLDGISLRFGTQDLVDEMIRECQNLITSM